MITFIEPTSTLHFVLLVSRTCSLIAEGGNGTASITKKFNITKTTASKVKINLGC
jgi:hypothetical protein